MICPRCTKAIPSDPKDGGIHTCTPTPLVRGLEARVAELEARLAEEVKDRDHWKALAESLSYPTSD